MVKRRRCFQLWRVGVVVIVAMFLTPLLCVGGNYLLAQPLGSLALGVLVVSGFYLVAAVVICTLAKQQRRHRNEPAHSGLERASGILR